MKISVPSETHPGENRAPLTPDSVAKLVKLGAQVELFLQIPRRLTEGDPVNVRCVARVVHVDGGAPGGRLVISPVFGTLP